MNLEWALNKLALLIVMAFMSTLGAYIIYTLFIFPGLAAGIFLGCIVIWALERTLK